MELVELKISVPQDIYNLEKALIIFAEKLSEQKQKGWVVGQDNGNVLASLADLYVELDKVAELKRLLIEDKMAAISGIVAGVLDANC